MLSLFGSGEKSKKDSKKDNCGSSTGTSLRDRGYTELRRLGKGSFGYAVLLVRNSREGNEHYVGKMIKYKHMSLTEKEYVLREVKTMAHISDGGGHPYLVRFRESFVLASGPLCIVMDYCDSGDLAQLLSAQRKKKTFFQESQIHLWLIQILSAIDFLHSLKVLHRDVKPANVFMHAKNVCKLGDMGLSKQTIMTATKPGAHTHCGSPLYLAPEVHAGQPYGKMIDIWALGCTVFELMALAHAFQGSSNAEILQNIVWARHAKLTGEGEVWSDKLCTLVKQMLSLNPGERPDANEMLNNPMFAEALGSGTLHPKALRHKQEKSGFAALLESPVGVEDLPLQMERPRSAPPSATPASRVVKSGL